jgi:phosphate transport system protein
MSDFQETRVQRMIEQDAELDALEAEVNERVLMVITVRAPRADDLRRVLSATKAAHSLERIGDYARNVGKRTAAIMESEADQLPWDQLIEIGVIVGSMIGDVMDAYQQGDLDTARAIRNSDLHVDKLHTNIFRHIVEQMDAGKISALNGAHLLFIAKNIERIGDFTTSLAEQIMFVETGVAIDTNRPKADSTSGLSDES